MAEPCRVRVILGAGSVGDYEYLDILEESAFRPEAFFLVSLDLVEGFFDWDSAGFQLDMDEREAVHEDCDIVAVLVRSLASDVLVYDLRGVLVYVRLVDELYVSRQPFVSGEHLNVLVSLNPRRLLLDSFALGGFEDVVVQESFPFVVGEMVVVEFFKLDSQVRHNFVFGVDVRIGIALLA